MHTLTQQELAQHLSQTVVHQELAIAKLSQALSFPPSRFQLKPAPIAGFMFIGPPYCGKKTMARALSKQLFQRESVLYYADAAPHYMQLADIPLQHTEDYHYHSIAEVIQSTPHAIIVFEECERLSGPVLHELQLILNTGHWKDCKTTYDFRQAMLIFNTTLGSQHFSNKDAVLDAENHAA